MFSRLRILALLAAGLSASPPPHVDVFRAGDNGYASYRIPALIVSPKGTLLAFCEGRRNSASDTGDIDVLLRRSFDNVSRGNPCRPSPTWAKTPWAIPRLWWSARPVQFCF